MASSVSIELVSSSARVTSVCTTSLTHIQVYLGPIKITNLSSQRKCKKVFWVKNEQDDIHILHFKTNFCLNMYQLQLPFPNYNFFAAISQVFLQLSFLISISLNFMGAYLQRISVNLRYSFRFVFRWFSQDVNAKS